MSNQKSSWNTRGTKTFEGFGDAKGLLKRKHFFDLLVGKTIR